MSPNIVGARPVGSLFEIGTPTRQRSSKCVAGGNEPYEISGISSAFGSNWHLDRRAFDIMLREAAVEVGADLRLKKRVRSVSKAAEGWQIVLTTLDASFEEETTFLVRACFLIDATGRTATIGKRLGARRQRVDRVVVRIGPFDAVPNANDDPVTLVEATELGWHYWRPCRTENSFMHS